MLPDNVFRPPLTSFARPVPGILIDPDLEPQISVSFNAAWLPYVLGALQPLTLSTTWKIETPNTLELQQKRAMMLLSLFTTPDPPKKPFYESDEDASDITLPDQPWYDNLADWVITGFLATTFSPGAGLVYKTTIPRLRVAFRTGNLGAFVRVLFDDLEIWTGDTYAPIEGLLEETFDVQGFAAEHNLGDPPYTMRIEHAGRPSAPGSGPGFAASAYKIEVELGDIRPRTEVAPMFRQSEDGCLLEYSSDGGDTWNTIYDGSLCAGPQGPQGPQGVAGQDGTNGQTPQLRIASE